MKKMFTRLGLAMALFACAGTASAQTELVVDGSVGYDQTLVQGQDYILPGTDETWYAIPEYFTHKEGNVWTFNAYPYAEYAYFFELKDNLKWINVEIRQVDDPTAYFANWELNKAIYVNGNSGIGFPSFATNQLNWDSGNGWAGNNSVAIAQIASGKYRLSMVIGEQQSASNVNFKFYGARPFDEGTFQPQRVGGILDFVENPYLRMNGAAEGDTGGLGDIYAADGAEFADGDTLIVNFEVINDNNVRVTVDYKELVVNDFPTFNGNNMEKRGNNFVFEGTLTQGAEFNVGNLGVTAADAATLYVDPILATKLGDGKYKFNAISGAYTAVLYPSLNYLKIWPGTYDAPATFADGKALWIIGSNIGQPTTAANNSNWGANIANSIPVAQVSDNVYKVKLTVGQEITSNVNFKFFGQYGWGKEFRGFDLVMEENDYLYLNETERTVNISYDDEGNENISVDWGSDPGNIKNGVASLGNGDVLTLTVDLNDYVPATYADEDADDPYAELDPGVKGKVTVEYEAYSGPMPTVNGVKMTSIDGGYKFVGDLKKNDFVVIGGDVAEVTDQVKAADFFYNYDYLTKVGDTSFKFNAIDGKYAIELDQNLNYFRIYPVQADGTPGIFTEEGGKATWVCGNSGIGFPSYAANSNNWGGNDGSWTQKIPISISPAQISDGIYRLTVTVGKQVTADAVFKFYDSYNYTITDGRESDVAADFIDLLDETIVYSGNDLAFNGLEDGATYVVVIDRTGERSTIKTEKADDETGHGTSVGIEAIQTVKGAENTAIYSLSGVRVSGATKGIFIQNGKKIVK